MGIRILLRYAGLGWRLPQEMEKPKTVYCQNPSLCSTRDSRRPRGVGLMPASRIIIETGGGVRSDLETCKQPF